MRSAALARIISAHASSDRGRTEDWRHETCMICTTTTERTCHNATGTFVTRAMLMHDRPYQKRKRPICMGTVAGCQLPGIRRPVRAAAQRPPRRSSMHCCRCRTLNGLLALCIVTFLPLLIPPISAAAAGELPKPDTAHCIGDKENPGKFGCAEAGWTSGAIPRNLGVRQRVEGSEAEKRIIIMTMVKTERYYDEEVPLMPKDVQENW